MALQFQGNRNSRMASVIKLDYDDVINKPGILLYDEQALTDAQRTQARENIAAVGYDAQSLTDEQKEQARENVEAQRFGIVDARDHGLSEHASAAENSTALSKAAAASGEAPYFVAAGEYPSNFSASVFPGRWFGPGRVLDSSGNQRAPWSSHITSRPTFVGGGGGPLFAFNGDFSKNHIASETYVSGTGTLGTPTTGYEYTTGAIPFYHYMFISSTAGHNESTSGNGGRTGMPIHKGSIFHGGNGDAVVYNGNVYVVGTKPGSTSFLANPAGVLLNGTVEAGANGIYANLLEINAVDNGFDIAAIGPVIGLKRENATGANGACWIGFRPQSTGSAFVDSFYSGVGKVNVGLDFSHITTNTSKAAVAVKANDRYYANASSSNGFFATSLGAVYFEYNSSISAWNWTGSSGSSVMQLYSDKLLSANPVWLKEQTSPATPISTYASYYPKSDGRFYQKNSAGVEEAFVTPASSDSFTNKSFDTAGVGNSFLINGVAVTANTGTGSVVRGTNPTIDGATLSTRLVKGVYVLGSGATSTSVTGTTSETALATISVPANVMGTNGILRVTSQWSYTNSANNKTLRTRLGGLSGTSFWGRVLTTSAGIRVQQEIQNQNSANSQIAFNAGSQSWDITSGAAATGSVDTTSTQSLVLTAQLANSAETITLERYLVELIIP